MIRRYLKNLNAVAGDRTRVTRVTGGNTYHYTTTTWMPERQKQQEEAPENGEEDEDELRSLLLSRTKVGSLKIDFNVGKSDRSVLKVSGKRVKRCCVKGSLLEVNERLIKQPQLLNSSAKANDVQYFETRRLDQKQGITDHLGGRLGYLAFTQETRVRFPATELFVLCNNFPLIQTKLKILQKVDTETHELNFIKEKGYRHTILTSN
ncbi:hypothetical protein YC2023_023374 [Brassica napus]